jgi:hypothetical protein
MKNCQVALAALKDDCGGAGLVVECDGSGGGGG